METNNKNAMVYIPANNWNELQNFMQNINSRMNNIDIEVLKPKEYIGVSECMKSYSLSRSFFEDLKRDGTIKTYKIRGKVMVKVSEIRKVFANAME